MVKFEWDSSKATSNKRKRGVTFEKAQSVFYDDFAIQFFDEGNAELEDRFFTRAQQPIKNFAYLPLWKSGRVTALESYLHVK